MTDTSELATAERRHLRRYQLFLAPAQARVAGPIDAFVEADPGFQQLRAEAEDSYDGRKFVPSRTH